MSRDALQKKKHYLVCFIERKIGPQLRSAQNETLRWSAMKRRSQINAYTYPSGEQRVMTSRVLMQGLVAYGSLHHYAEHANQPCDTRRGHRHAPHRLPLDFNVDEALN
eukprot:IDg15407t1